MVQITGYPGVYTEEFTPPTPIQGVGTSTVAFVGTAAQGPIGVPVRLHSWDAFVAKFGDLIIEAPESFLAPAVRGFFMNGGTDCYVLRVATAKRSSTNLLRRPTGNQAVLAVEAVAEGPMGDTIAVRVTDTSRLADVLPAGQTALDVHRASEAITAALPAAAPNRNRVTVNDNSAFRIGERVVLQRGAANNPTVTQLEYVVTGKQGLQVLVLSDQVEGNNTFTNNGRIRSADVVPGQRELLVDVPAGVRLSQGLPYGTTIQVAPGGTATTTPEVRTVFVAGDGNAGPTVTLTEAMRTRFSLNEATPPSVASLEWDLEVTQGTDAELWERLSMHPGHGNYWGTRVQSRLITLAERTPTNPPTDPRPRQTTVPQALSGGAADDRVAAWATLTPDPTSVLDLLAPFEEIDIVCIPGLTDPDAQAMIVAHAEATRRFAILDAPPRTTTAPPIEDHVGKVRGTDFRVGHAALYYPWILARHPKTNKDVYWPPSGHIAGVYARTDQQGVHTAPANEPIIGAKGVEVRLTDNEQAPLNLAGINVLRMFMGTGQPVVWGARTTYTANVYWQYVNVRRLFLYLEKSIEIMLRTEVFSPNNPALWGRLKRSIGDFLFSVFQSGAFGGKTPKDSFYVRIDEALNPEAERVLGRLHIEVGVRPAYPAEFIVLHIGIWDGGVTVTES